MNYPIWNGNIPFFDPAAETPDNFTFYPAAAEAPKPCVVVLPGGGYLARAPHEGAPIGAFFQANGLHAAVVDYRVAPNRFPAGLADAKRVIRTLRARADEWKIDPEQIFVCGFSAGGHLAASTALWQDVYEKTDEIDEYSDLPNGLILCYTLVSFCEEWGHPKSGKRLLGEERCAAEGEQFCLSDRVTEATPPTFLWHTADDATVPVRNALEFAKALAANGVPFALHVFPHGKHGLALAEGAEDVHEWTRLVLQWIRDTATRKDG